jgi:putative effector of murein hydrolase LrgA (UPF0299 family)
MAKYGMDSTLGAAASPVYSLSAVGDQRTKLTGWTVSAAGLAVLIALSVGGDLAAGALGIAAPGPVLGMGAYLLLLALVPGMESLTAPAAKALLKLLGALIVPAAVGLAAFAPFVADAAGELALVLAASTVVTGLTTALLYAGLKR